VTYFGEFSDKIKKQVVPVSFASIVVYFAMILYIVDEIRNVYSEAIFL
jgi:hypothetical protein